MTQYRDTVSRNSFSVTALAGPSGIPAESNTSTKYDAPGAAARTIDRWYPSRSSTGIEWNSVLSTIVLNRPSDPVGQPVKSVMSATSNEALVSPCLAASALANLIAVGEASSPTVLWPNAAMCNANAASPQPASSTSPWILP